MRLLRYLVAVSILLFSCQQAAHAQRKLINMADHDHKLYYFGITFGLNFSQYRLQYKESFALQDTFKSIQPLWAPGFNLGLMANLRLTNFIDIRTTPSLSFAEKRFQYTDPLQNELVTKSIESVYLQIPLQVKFKSDRIGNFRFYGIAGGKFDFDLAANSRSRRRDEFLKVTAADLGLELGAGFEFYYPNFIFAPEIKISQGFKNQLFNDPSLPLTNAIDEIKTRMIVISIHLEG